MGILFTRIWRLFNHQASSPTSDLLFHRFPNVHYAGNITPETKVPSYVGSEHKVIIVGLDNAGKTTILYQFSMNEVVHTSPTIGSNVEEIVVNNTRFLMWDIGGQESLRSSWNTYYTNTEFVIVVVDSTDRERISVTKEELYKMLAHEDLKKAGLLIFANKQDVKECMTVAEISQFLKLTSIKDHQWHIQACCALTGEGLCQGLEWMMSRLKIR
ncbi:ADP-ribosylation factor-like protein 5A isoform X1 [Neopsephotus bourkii]|uniref:ADP-ribosylation factor-like protein 5A isoform X1 n=1 Tax=Neopsephotus bourkii TaxID=309878 RepID=UPI002AA58BE1|nr:ADP-ribosylation factor-like protein 5A isoform X1 [Neopsephotus bourkii]